MPTDPQPASPESSLTPEQKLEFAEMCRPKIEPIIDGIASPLPALAELPTPAELDESDRICREFDAQPYDIRRGHVTPPVIYERNQQLREANARIVELEGLLLEARSEIVRLNPDGASYAPRILDRIDAALGGKAGA